ncbi:bZIP 2 domain containing protein [Asbolus verrucosus]|uniref:X-box-binding protein 1 n=1 Tax=Asbolus verrucosus TaxID=1661398 RepID=A0A482WCY9_ASBVE|nr:bZIP 2 domain containing protein [Asbolus verrucosus]
MASAVPAILKYLSDSSNYNIVDQNIETPVRAKKRRLDHLSWEEKLQRKKLKNRVAAQTSRDRKKAKMDQMEKAVQELFTKNEVLLEECEKLKKMNERLSAENAELRTKLTSVPPSAARNGHTLSSGSETADHNGTVEDCIGLPSLPDLLDELNSDVDISSLEQLTQSLLQDIARDLEAAAEKADIQVSGLNEAQIHLHF